MRNYHKIGENISSHLRSLGYNVKSKAHFSWVEFYIDDTFLFWGDLEILPEKECEEIILEILKEKTNVSIPAKVTKS